MKLTIKIETKESTGEGGMEMAHQCHVALAAIAKAEEYLVALRCGFEIMEMPRTPSFKPISMGDCELVIAFEE